MRVLIVWLSLVSLAATAAAQPPAVERLKQARDLARAGRPAEAIPLYEAVLPQVEAELGTDSPALAVLYHELATQHAELGRDAEAEPLLRRALAIAEQAFGPEHAELLPSLDGLAELSTRQRRHAEAEALHRRSLGILEAHFGFEHPQVARTLAQLGLVSYLQENYGEAEDHYSRSLEIGGRAGLDAGELGTTVNNLATLYFQQNRPAAAETQFRRALDLRREALGHEHPDTAFSLSQLAMFYRRQNRLDAAAALYEESLAAQEQALGRSHPVVASSLVNLGVIHRLENRNERAEPLFRRALAIAEENLGPSHPDVAASVNNLAVLLSDLGRYDEAEELYRRSLAIEEARGSDHVAVAFGLMNLASVHLRQDERAEAAAAAERAKAILNDRCAGGARPSSSADDRSRAEVCGNASKVYEQVMERLNAGGEASAEEPPIATPPAEAPPIAAPPAEAPPTTPPAVAVVAPPAAAKSPPTAAPQPAAPRTLYRAQVASRRDPSVAQQELDKLRRSYPALLANLPSRIQRANLGDQGVWHRIQFGEFGNTAEARALCTALAEQGEDCLVVASLPG